MARDAIIVGAGHNGLVIAACLAAGRNDAAIVVSNIDPRLTFLKMIDPRHMPEEFVQQIVRYRREGTSSFSNVTKRSNEVLRSARA